MTKKIAIVEDEAAIRENYAAAFRREGYAVDLYDARRPAMDAFDARLPDLVVIDINLKDEVEGGFEPQGAAVMKPRVGIPGCESHDQSVDLPSGGGESRPGGVSGIAEAV